MSCEFDSHVDDTTFKSVSRFASYSCLPPFSDIPDQNTWLPDNSFTNCLMCYSLFTTTHRRHHCRNCGLLLCSYCANNTISVKQLERNQTIRVCNACYSFLIPRDKQTKLNGLLSFCLRVGICQKEQYQITKQRQYSLEYFMSQIRTGHEQVQLLVLRVLLKFSKFSSKTLSQQDFIVFLFSISTSFKHKHRALTFEILSNIIFFSDRKPYLFILQSKLNYKLLLIPSLIKNDPVVFKTAARFLFTILFKLKINKKTALGSQIKSNQKSDEALNLKDSNEKELLTSNRLNLNISKNHKIEGNEIDNLKENEKEQEQEQENENETENKTEEENENFLELKENENENEINKTKKIISFTGKHIASLLQILSTSNQDRSILVLVSGILSLLLVEKKGKEQKDVQQKSEKNKKLYIKKKRRKSELIKPLMSQGGIPILMKLITPFNSSSSDALKYFVVKILSTLALYPKSLNQLFANEIMTAVMLLKFCKAPKVILKVIKLISNISHSSQALRLFENQPVIPRMLSIFDSSMPPHVKLKILNLLSYLVAKPDLIDLLLDNGCLTVLDRLSQSSYTNLSTIAMQSKKPLMSRWSETKGKKIKQERLEIEENLLKNWKGRQRKKKKEKKKEKKLEKKKEKKMEKKMEKKKKN
ncbi:pleckstrin homology domain-containing family f member 2-related [Anaeramoeba flamelloides]|uniref:Pleckstrin homology domain-containing family f member 2-related n=1 Tax=Anaeramoeba flamelloides TaxID=1746091 RepID=A0AAV8ACW4_9EUKA|nr:pleckstrin homology domain-containing family f member 2-related [Anaeramoeba flamelloides]